MGSTVKVLPLNVNSLHDKVKMKRLKTMLYNLKPTIVMLQETHFSHDSTTVFKDRAFPYQFHSKGTSKARGTAILIHKSLQFKELTVTKDTKGRFLAVKGIINGELMTLASIYAPNSAQVSFIEEIFQKLTDFGEGTLVAAGDLNYIPDLKMDRSYRPSQVSILKDNVFTKLHLLMDKYNVLDSWRYTHPTAKDYTFYSSRHKVYTRIDLILLSRTDTGKIIDADIGATTISDHSWTSCELQLGPPTARDRRRTLNRTLLHSDLVVPEIAKEIHSFLKENTQEGTS